MRKKHNTAEGGCRNWAILLGILCCSSVLAYLFVSRVLNYSSSSGNGLIAVRKESCCRGVQHLELWGKVVVWGDRNMANNSEDCCRACKAICKTESGGSCHCNSWVYCGDKEKCGNRFRQCWLKKQDDPLAPDIQASGQSVMWTSGLLYENRTGVMGIETEHGIIRIKLLMDCAPYSIAYLLGLLKVRHCTGCHFYRAEGRGSTWNEEGELIGQATTEGPYALIQGSLGAQTVTFNELPKEACPVVQRGSVGWIGGGPDFFISLANHDEWYSKHTIFAHVFKEDMHIVEKIADLPTVASTWSGVDVQMLPEPLPLKIVKTNTGVASV